MLSVASNSYGYEPYLSEENYDLRDQVVAGIIITGDDDPIDGEH